MRPLEIHIYPCQSESRTGSSGPAKREAKGKEGASAQSPAVEEAADGATHELGDLLEKLVPSLLPVGVLAVIGRASFALTLSLADEDARRRPLGAGSLAELLPAGRAEGVSVLSGFDCSERPSGRRPERSKGTDLASTQQYLTPASSARTGRCERMSIGVMLDASSRRPFSPLRSDLTTSLTPRLSCRAFDAATGRQGMSVSATQAQIRTPAGKGKLLQGRRGQRTLLDRLEQLLAQLLAGQRRSDRSDSVDRDVKLLLLRLLLLGLLGLSESRRG
jgi:hypothetical protein